MDSAAFDLGRGAIPLLTARQRQEGLMYLALAEADDEAASFAADALPMSIDGSSDAADSKPVGATAESDDRPMPASASAAAQSRLASAGCPHCAGRRLHRWGHASDLTTLPLP